MIAAQFAAAASVTVLVFSHGESRVVTAEVEDYVARVVASETVPGTPPEALKAQAVVTRSFALAAARRGAGRHAEADLCSLAHCQVWRSSIDPAHLADARAAAVATAGVVLRLSKGGAIAETPFHAACGGHTADPHELFGGEGTGAAAVSDPECPREPWTARFTRGELDAALTPLTGRTELGELTLVRGAGGWIVQVRAPDGPTPGERSEWGPGAERAVSGDAFARALDAAKNWGVVKSGRFEWRQTASGDVILSGTGSGHGAGLCQRGAELRARRGETWEAILLHYFPHAKPARQ